ncbi:NAD(P)-dependent oxidoreductase [Streptomyces bauhiniae]|uniref:NAD(P)-dependent oxidoreductase n=1 Tax=Streptomyces bauhiniae TaxID=2340725 RepID=A0A4Z1DE35_9ACTN|nr:DUF1932 domain-containing protein [Streptomyces bauhiniae]TGN81312.1 NAD(P)-dependent oxidoreductase [Streptomyces bauhiniae]
MSEGRRYVGVLHPGSMGAAVAAQLRDNGVPVAWCEAGRGEATLRRAEQAGLVGVPTLEELVRQCDLLLSICPPAAAEQVARQVAAYDFTGVFVEANAVTPARVERISTILPKAQVVDGALIGSPPRGGKRPTLFLSGCPDATERIESLFVGTDVRTRVLGDGLGRVSALKLAYTSYQKASRVLAVLSYAVAADHGVEEELLEVAGARPGSYLSETGYFAKTAARAWRWGPELEEAAQLLEDAGLPAGPVSEAASALMRWAGERDASISRDDLLALLHVSPLDD